MLAVSPATARASHGTNDGDIPLGPVFLGGMLVSLVYMAFVAGSAVATVVVSGMTVHDAIAHEEHDRDLITAGYATGGTWAGAGALIFVTGSIEGHDDPLFYGGVASLLGLGALSLTTALVSDLTDGTSPPGEPRRVHDDGIRLDLIPTLSVPDDGEFSAGLLLSIGFFE
jgi:hypothetical protein